MKRRIIIITAALSAAIGCVIASRATINSIKDIITENVEALMDLELISGGTFIVTAISDGHWICKQGGTYYCPMP